MFKTDEYGMSIGFATLPFGREPDFYKQEFKEGILKNYKDGINKVLEKRGSGLCDEKLYKPIVYGLFGTYDCAILNLIDDTIFNSRSFLPFSAFSSSEEHSAYDYQSIAAIHPIVDNRKLYDKAQETFLQLESFDHNNKELIGICQLKLSSTLLIGNGGVLTYHVIKSLSQDLDKSGLSYILLETYSYNELILLVFGNDASAILNELIKIREKRICDLFSEGEEQDRNKLISTSLLSHLVSPNFHSDQKEQKEFSKFYHNHIFESSITELGFNLDMIENGYNNQRKLKGVEESIKSKIQSVGLEIKTTFTIQPGHLMNTLDSCHEIVNEKTKIKYGKGDLLLDWGDASLVSTIDLMYKLIVASKKNIIDINTSISIIFDSEIKEFLKSIQFNDECHQQVNSVIHKDLEIPKIGIVQIKDKLKSLGISIVSSQRIMSALSNYNLCVNNHYLFGYFIETSSFFINVMIESIFQYDSNKENLIENDWTVSDLEALLSKLCDIFEACFRSRFFNSLPTYDLINFNFLYKSSVQQLISSADTMFKISHNLLSLTSRFDSLIYLSGKSNTQAFQACMRINFFHLFHPEILISSSTHEASNFFLEQLLQQYLQAPKSEVLKGLDFDKHELFKIIGICGLDQTLSNLDIKNIKFDEGIGESVLYRSQEKKFIVEDIVQDFHEDNFVNGLDWRSFWGYVFRDILTLRIGYSSNFKLFNFWHWIHVYQTPNAYIRPNHINRNVLVTLYFRMAVINEYLRVSEGNEYEIQCFCPSMRKDWDLVVKPLSRFVKNFVDLELVKECLAQIDRLAKEWRNMKLQDSSNQIFSYHNLKPEINKLKEKLSEDKTPPVSRKATQAEILRKSSTIMIAYLEILMSHFDNEKRVILYRNPDNGRPIIDPEGQVCSKLCVDPRGGLFVSDKELRKKYWKLRLTMHKSFWHISQILKKTYYTQTSKELKSRFA